MGTISKKQRGISDYAVVYDISSDAERRRVDKTLQDFGFRIQKSVFECRMKRQDREELVLRLKGLELKTGFVKLYKLIFKNKRDEIGYTDKISKDDSVVFVI